METQVEEDVSLDYQDYRFGRSKQFFRGPEPNLRLPYVAFIGGAETYGRFVARPYPDILRDELSVGVANWATPDAGPSFYLKDPIVLEACSNARVCVVCLSSAFAMTNRHYTVYLRRNNRLYETSDTLRALYPEVDFDQFRFVRTMLLHLRQVNAANFKVVELEIKRAWVARMRDLLQAIETPIILLWFSDRPPEESGLADAERGMGPEMIDRSMLAELADHVSGIVEYSAPEDVLNPDGSDRIFEEADMQVALYHPGGDMHMDAAEMLFEPIKRELQNRALQKQRARSAWNFLGQKK